MRCVTPVVLLAGLALTACASPEGGSFEPGTPQLAHVADLDGTPDLAVDGKALATSWVVYDQDLRESFCTLAEGGTPPGVHRVLRFSVTTPNLGDADVALGDPNTHVDPNGDGDFSDSDGLYDYDTCHRHFHFQNYALYQLIDPTGRVILARKRGFCMIDTTPWNNGAGVGSWVYRVCGRPARDGLAMVRGKQGISVGYADTYTKWLGGQYFVLDDAREPVPPGPYLLRITVNPPFICGPLDRARPRDPRGLCHNFLEANYDNNVAQIAITIPDRPGKTGFGPGGGGSPRAEIVDDENRPES